MVIPNIKKDSKPLLHLLIKTKNKKSIQVKMLLYKLTKLINSYKVSMNKKDIKNLGEEEAIKVMNLTMDGPRMQSLVWESKNNKEMVKL